MKESAKHRAESAAGRKDLPKRSWPTSLSLAAALVGIGVTVSAVVNPLFGRSVHWDWMGGLAPTLLLILTVAIRRRWA